MTDVTVVVVEDAAPSVEVVEPGPQGSAGPPGTTDHHELVNLADGDDHPQYLNDARGDARYEPSGAVAAGVAAEANVRSQADTDETAARTAADAAEAAARAAADTTEANARSQADTTLQGHLDAEATTRADADATLTTDLDAETTARTAADATLTTDLNAETDARTAADTAEVNARTAAVAAEANTRAAADTALGGRVDAETTARTAADATLTQNLDTETTARTAADTALGGRIDGEATTRAAADTAEASARNAADTAHVGATDPHGQYLTQPRGDARYLTPLAADGRYDAIGDANSALASARSYTDTAIAGVVPLSMRGAANGVATLDGAGLIPTSQLPPLAISQPFTVTTMDARLALNAQRGDTAYQSDEGTWWILATDSPATAADWKRLTPPGVVTSVNGHVGPAVNLTAADVGALTQAQGDARYDAIGSASIVQTALTNLDARVVHTAGGDTITTTTIDEVGLTITSTSDVLNAPWPGNTPTLQKWVAPDDGTGYQSGSMVDIYGDYSTWAGDPGALAWTYVSSSGLNADDGRGGRVYVSASQIQVVMGPGTTGGLIVNGEPGDSGRLVEFDRGDAEPVFMVDPNGLVTLPNPDTQARSELSPGHVLLHKGISDTSDYLTMDDQVTGLVMASVTSLGRYAGSGADLTAASVTAVPLTVKGVAGQTGNLQEWRDSTNTLLSRVPPDGSIRAPYARFIANAATVMPMWIQAAAGQTADLQQVLSSGGAQVGKIDSTGRVYVQPVGSAPTNPGSMNVRPASATSIGLMVAGIAGQSTELVRLDNSSGTKLWGIAGSGLVQGSNRTVVGSITVDPGGTLNAVARSATEQPIIARGFASQTGDLQQWQDSTGAVKSRVDSAGNHWVGSTQLGGGGATSPLVLTSTAVAQVPITARGMVGQTGDLTQWQDSTPTALAGVRSDGSAYFGANAAAAIAAGLTVMPTSSAGTAVKIRAQSGQSASLQEWQNSAGVLATMIDNNGNINMTAGTRLLTSSGVSNAIINANPEQTGRVGIAVRASAGQTGDLILWQDSGGVASGRIKANGELESSVSAVSASDAGGGKGGIVLKSPSGTRYRLTVSDTGALTSVAA